MEVIQGKIGSARQISFEQLRNDIVLYEHQSLATSIFFSFQLADSEWPVHQQILFALAYGIAMYRIARKLQKGRQPLFDPFLYRFQTPSKIYKLPTCGDLIKMRLRTQSWPR